MPAGCSVENDSFWVGFQPQSWELQVILVQTQSAALTPKYFAVIVSIILRQSSVDPRNIFVIVPEDKWIAPRNIGI